VFPLPENLWFWAVTAALCIGIWAAMRRYVRRQLAKTRPASIRSARQLSLHRGSILLLALPLGYVAFVDGQPFWAVISVLWVQVGLMLLLRMLGLGFKVRVWLVALLAVLSVAVGAAVAIWPVVEAARLASAPWALLALTALAVGASTLLSIYSFPLGFGERAK